MVEVEEAPIQLDIGAIGVFGIVTKEVEDRPQASSASTRRWVGTLVSMS